MGFKQTVLPGLLLAAFVLLQCFLPMGTAVKIGGGGDFELSKTTLSPRAAGSSICPCIGSKTRTARCGCGAQLGRTSRAYGGCAAG